MADAEVGIKLINFTRQQTNPVLGTQQALGGSYNADVIPHKAAQFIPVVRDNDFFIGIGDAAFIPVRQCFRCWLWVGNNHVRSGA